MGVYEAVIESEYLCAITWVSYALYPYGGLSIG